MWNRMLAEAVVIAVQTVILIGLCATIGVSGSGRKAEAESGRPLGLDFYQPEPADNPATPRESRPIHSWGRCPKRTDRKFEHHFRLHRARQPCL